MDQTFSFVITPMDTKALCPQVSQALEKRTELLGRQKNPRLWAVIDKLNSVPKVSPQVSVKRRRRMAFWSLLIWLLSLVLLIPGCMEPRQMPLGLAAGLGGFVLGSAVLWVQRRRLLGGLSLAVGILLGLCVAGGRGELDRLLVCVAVGIVLGLAALLIPNRRQTNAFEKAAHTLLDGRDAPLAQPVRAVFSDEGLALCQADLPDRAVFPFGTFEMALETADLLLVICGERILPLQKTDLAEGSFAQLREFLQQKTQYADLNG